MLGLVYLVDSAVFCKFGSERIVKIDPIGAFKHFITFSPHPDRHFSNVELLSEFLSLFVMNFALSSLLYFIVSGLFVHS
jgi:hypothetical protein